MKQCDTMDWGSWHLHEGQEGTLTEDLPTLCCDHVIPAGIWIRIHSRYSKKRAFVQVGNHPNTPNRMIGSFHKVKASKVCFA